MKFLTLINNWLILFNRALEKKKEKKKTLYNSKTDWEAFQKLIENKVKYSSETHGAYRN